MRKRAVMASLVLVACGSPTFTLAPTDAGATDDAPSDLGADAAADGPVPTKCPQEMVLVPRGVTSFCIDRTETSVADYDAFERSGYNVSKITPPCRFKTGLTPADTNLSPKQPIANIDWCDAWAYCDTKGKRLCRNAAMKANEGEWYLACSGPNAQSYPYGPSYDATRCNGKDANKSASVSVGSLTRCTGSVDGLFDMSGNVAEWDDACVEGSTPSGDTCLAHGGSFADPAEALACASTVARQRGSKSANIGFRCCMAAGL
jgi:formylglycine-generating enzyme required for sulfatase activity